MVHISRIKAIVRSLYDDYAHALSEITQEIEAFKVHVVYWGVYAVPCCFFVPLLGAMFNGAYEDTMQRQFNNAWYEVEGLHENNLLSGSSLSIWKELQNQGRMTDPHWGRVKDDGLRKMNRMLRILESMQPNWETVWSTRGSGNLTTSVSAVPSAPPMLSAEMSEITARSSKAPVAVATASIIPASAGYQVVPSESSSSSNLANKLSQLKDALDANVITQEDFDKTRKIVLDSFC